MKIINYTNLRLNLKKWLDVVVDDVVEIIVTRKNNKNLVLISLDEYNSLKETQHLLSGKNGDVILASLQEAKAGNTVENELLPE